MRLYDDEFSPNCQKVRALAAYLEIPLEREPVAILRGETRRPSFLRINPDGKIPVLADGSLVLAESNAILVHLAQHAKSQLWPASAVDQCRILQWLFWQTARFSAAVAKVAFQRLIRPHLLSQACDETAADVAMAEFLPIAGILEQRLAPGTFVAGDLSVADFALGAWASAADDAGMLDSLPALRRWLGRLSGLRGWQEARPMWSQADV